MKRDIDLELWTRPNRRLDSLGDDLILPATINETVPVRDRVDVWAFQDTSGSCVDYAERFFKAIATIPEDRFRVRVFCFDTEVYETSLATGKLYGFGGTAFQPMEDKIQQIIQTERWHWFLTPDGSKAHIPNKSSIYDLNDYE